MYNGRHKYFDSNIHFFHVLFLEGCEIRDKLHVLNMKADDYIEKPINIDELEEKMLQLLHKLS